MSTAAPIVTSSPTDTSVVNERTSSLSSTITALVACITPMIALLYICALTWTYKFARRNPRPLNKTSGVRLQQYAPIVYIFLVLSSLAEVAVSSWLILQYRFHHNYPSIVVRNGTRFILFCASWTSGTGGAYSILFLHPSWSRHPVSSIGTQALWVLITWIFWVAGAGTINTAIPTLLVRGQCDGIAYCGQLRTLFAMAVISSLALTTCMVTLAWLIWQSTRSVAVLRPRSEATIMSRLNY